MNVSDEVRHNRLMYSRVDQMLETVLVILFGCGLLILGITDLLRLDALVMRNAPYAWWVVVGAYVAYVAFFLRRQPWLRRKR